MKLFEKLKSMAPREIIEKVQQTINLTVPFVIGVVGVWSKSLDITAYVTGAAAVIEAGLEYAKLFIKD